MTQGRLPWMGNFVLRMFPFDMIGQTLSQWGYVTERLDQQLFKQRDFASANEEEQVIECLHDVGISTIGKEDEGRLLAEFYLSRPKADVASLPIEDLLTY